MGKNPKTTYGWLILVIIGTGLTGLWWFVKNDQPLTSQQLYSRYNQIYPVIDHPSVDEAQRAFFLYRKGEYAMASNAFQRLLKKSPQHPAYLFYKGQSDMQSGSFDSAIKAFHKVLTQDTLQNSFVPQAKWYLALCSLQTGNISRSRKLLGQLTQKGGEYAERADDLLTSLDQRAKPKEGAGK